MWVCSIMLAWFYFVISRWLMMIIFWCAYCHSFIFFGEVSFHIFCLLKICFLFTIAWVLFIFWIWVLYHRFCKSHVLRICFCSLWFAFSFSWRIFQRLKIEFLWSLSYWFVFYFVVNVFYILCKESSLNQAHWYFLKIFLEVS